MMTRKTVQLVFAACLGLVVGCSGSSGERTADAEAKAPTNPVERIKFEISNLASNVTKGYSSDRKYFSDLAKRVGELSSLERDEAFTFAMEALRKPALKEYPLSDRELSLDTYVTTIRRVTTVFLMTCDFKEKIWDFLLQALSVFDEEVRIVNAPGVDPHEPECGFSIMAGDYELEIEHMRFYAIREKFEDNQMFGRYYRELPPERQKEWIERIEKAARRKVVIYDMNHPEVKLPRMPFLLPSYYSESEKERRREERRKLLRAAGIDPAEEGL